MRISNIATINDSINATCQLVNKNSYIFIFLHITKNYFYKLIVKKFDNHKLKYVTHKVPKI